ncbi:hypothetical protein BACSTE_03131 [Bacteroides stercoris ATCC 43183]|uniref:Uncharacterized protein n=1 Tax=Bacteroides stercoris ATCC 43183 TaxID=449673 RepID=B0NUE6_BACSE|nr:hypothetical protein BACSTE_03131 [Bacteroides stercoris ATCC 43183]
MQPGCIHSCAGRITVSGNYRSSKDGRGRTKPCGTCDERAVKRFQVDKLLPDTRFLGQSQEFEKRFGK